MSLASWERAGFLDRELAYYRRLAHSFGGVGFFTYDRSITAEQRAALGTIDVIFNRIKLPYRVFGIVGPLRERAAVAPYAVVKTNQLSGAWTAAIAARVANKPLLVRCGYVQSRNMQRQGAPAARIALTRRLESASLRAARLVCVATEDDAGYLVSNFGIERKRIRLLPNAVDTDLFRPTPNDGVVPGRVAYVGRLSEEKNVEILIRACARTPGCTLVVAGSGPLEASLRRLARDCGADVQFAGAVPHRQLPDLLASAKAFVLPSRFEGSPKALLEAMACGLTVVGSRSPGITGVITDGVNGILCDPTVDGVATALTAALGNVDNALGRAAREYVLGRHSLRVVLALETSFLEELVQSRAPD